MTRLSAIHTIAKEYGEFNVAPKQRKDIIKAFNQHPSTHTKELGSGCYMLTLQGKTGALTLVCDPNRDIFLCSFIKS